MNSARLILIFLIYAVPAILLIDSPIVQGLVAAILAAGIAAAAGAIRQGEAGFLLSVARPVVTIAIIPVLWMLVQILPLNAAGPANPIWQSAEQALGYSIRGHITVDPGATLLALGGYLSALAVMLLAAAVAVDRERAEWVLFALVAATALVAAVMIGHEVSSFAFWNESVRAQAKACVALGVIFAAAAAIRTFERYETGHLRPDRSIAMLGRTLVACALALMLCAIALALEFSGTLVFAVAYGLGMLLAVVAIRRIGLGSWGCAALVAAAAIVTVAGIASRLPSRPGDLTLAFASDKPDSAIASAQRILTDAPWAGTGAGTYAAMLPVYQDAGDIMTDAAAPTTAADIAVELGRPMLWAMVAAVIAGVFLLLRGAMLRGRDSFYPAAGASSLLLLLFLSFSDNGVLGSPVAICAAAIVGVAFAQSKSRVIA